MRFTTKNAIILTLAITATLAQNDANGLNGNTGASTCTKVPNCLSCPGGTTCSTCRQGYKLDPNGKCFACPANCAVCSDATTCTQCAQGWFISAGTNGAKGCSSCPANCLSCGSPTVCLVCTPGFYVGPTGRCGACSPGCEACDNNGRCLRCRAGYTAKDGLCQVGAGVDNSVIGFILVALGVCFACIGCAVCANNMGGGQQRRNPYNYQGTQGYPNNAQYTPFGNELGPQGGQGVPQNFGGFGGNQGFNNQPGGFDNYGYQ